MFRVRERQLQQLHRQGGGNNQRLELQVHVLPGCRPQLLRRPHLQTAHHGVLRSARQWEVLSRGGPGRVSCDRRGLRGLHAVDNGTYQHMR